MKVIFTGDLFLGGDVSQIQQPEQLITCARFWNADKRIVNLEQAVSQNQVVLEKATLHTGYEAIEKLKRLKIEAVNLAHNHIQDKGLEGIVETVNILRQNNIHTFGAGATLTEARKPYRLSEKIVLLGYCQYGKPYLNQITVATQTEPGVAPLDEKIILDDLNKLNHDEKAILYFHWGREHVSLPPHENIELAKRLLKHDKVLTIIGMHPHRIQSYIEYNGKKAFFSLGNFLFPNFYMQPPLSIVNHQPSTNRPVKTTYRYHRVFDVTYKKWKRINRVSLLLEWDSITNKIELLPVVQDNNTPRIRPLSAVATKIIFIKLAYLKWLYRLPGFIYKRLETINTFWVTKWWRFHIAVFYVRQLGIAKMYNMIKER